MSEERGARSEGGTAPRSRDAGLTGVVAGTITVAAAYAAAFVPGVAPFWPGALMGLGITLLILGVIALGARRPRQGLGRLRGPLALLGLLPALILPLIYALTFDDQTLNAEDLERLRRLTRGSGEQGR